MVKLYRILKDGRLKFVDYGVRKYANMYVQQGYVVFYLPTRKGVSNG